MHEGEVGFELVEEGDVDGLLGPEEREVVGEGGEQDAEEEAGSCWRG